MSKMSFKWVVLINICTKLMGYFSMCTLCSCRACNGVVVLNIWKKTNIANMTTTGDTSDQRHQSKRQETWRSLRDLHWENAWHRTGDPMLEVNCVCDENKLLKHSCQHQRWTESDGKLIKCISDDCKWLWKSLNVRSGQKLIQFYFVYDNFTLSIKNHRQMYKRYWEEH